VLDNGTIVMTSEPTGVDGPPEVDPTVTTPEPESEPKPVPGDPGYDWAPHYDTDDLYTHTFGNGKVVALKSFRKIFSKTWLLKMSELPTNIDVELAAIRRAACPAAMQFLLTLPDDGPDDPVADLYTAWLDSGTDGLTPGESGG
jgi:hypothetical protein